jgi:GTP-binding protein
MIIHDAKFVMSNSSISGCPKSELPEYAFIGRSNVGKSSLINMLFNKKGLAKTSSTPGKTQLINHFIVNEKADTWYLVDLPGYGFAKVSKTQKQEFSGIIRNYIQKRNNLLLVFVLLDSRLPFQKIDLNFMSWLAEKNIPFANVLTKTDKVSPLQLKNNIDNINKEILKHWETLPTQFISSAENKKGKEEILDYINLNNKEYSEIQNNEQ